MMNMTSKKRIEIMRNVDESDMNFKSLSQCFMSVCLPSFICCLSKYFMSVCSTIFDLL